MQACASDVLLGDVDARRMRCVVLDEAHHGKDDHPYAQLVEFIEYSGANFRVMGLSTALASRASALEVLTMPLRIETIEHRTVESPDVKHYVPSLVLCELTHDLRSMKMVLERVR